MHPPPPTTAPSASCPSCKSPMEVLQVQSSLGRPLELDLCFACHGIWFDTRESLQLSHDSVLSLFKTLYAHRDEPHTPLKERMNCPRCSTRLERGADRTKSGPYVVYRCVQHGRFGTFSSFMVEKGFVRHLTKPEIQAIAESLRVIHCSSCGAAVDLRQDHACPYCRSAFSLLDPQAVEKALARYSGTERNTAMAAETTPRTTQASLTSAEVLLATERIRMEHERERRQRRQESWRDGAVGDELWSAGVNLVWRAISRVLD